MEISILHRFYKRQFCNQLVLKYTKQSFCHQLRTPVTKSERVISLPIGTKARVKEASLRKILLLPLVYHTVTSF